MAPRATITGFAAAALVRKFSSKRNSEGAAEPASPVHLDSAASASDELVAVRLDDGSIPIGMTPEDAITLQQMRRASADQVAPLQRGGSAREALNAAESGLSARELRQQHIHDGGARTKAIKRPSSHSPSSKKNTPVGCPSSNAPSPLSS